MSQYVVSFPGLGLSFSLNRVAFSIGGFSVYWYGLLIACGLALAIAFTERHAVEFGIDKDRFVDVVFAGTILGIACARIYYIIFAPFEYASLWEMLDLRKGGLAIYGGIIGGFFFGFLASKIRKVPPLPVIDLVSMGFLIGQCIGRWGNFFNQEAFGCNTSLPWGMYSDATKLYLESGTVTAAAGVTIDPSLPVHPTFLYESLWCLIGFLLLASYYKKRKFNGDLVLRYVIWYGLGRFWIESLRTDSLMLIPALNLRTSQCIAGVSVLVGMILEVILTRRAKGKTFKVNLAVSNDTLAMLGKAEVPFTASLPAGESRETFLKETESYNKKLQEMLSNHHEEN